jgi:predicted RNA-binding Zn ribbon-like protein
VFCAATGAHPTDEVLRAAVAESVRLADDPDALNDYLTATPAYLRAVLAMDRERGTQNTNQVVTALSGLALAMLAADGRAEPEEDSVFTTHIGHLRGLIEHTGH